VCFAKCRYTAVLSYLIYARGGEKDKPGGVEGIEGPLRGGFERRRLARCNHQGSKIKNGANNFMQSHTVPRKVLEQFAYDDAVTSSKRLWRYEKGRRPYPKASPRTATRIGGHFSDPEDAAKEAELETRLNREFEEPVNSFLFEITDPAFVPTDARRRRLTFYVQVLFSRSEARRKASTHLQKVEECILKLFIDNESQVQTVAAKWSMDLLLSGRVRSGFVTTADVIASARNCAARLSETATTQKGYVRMIEYMMSTVDDKLLTGEWNYLRTVPTDPFIISDAPVVTWERMPNGQLSYGVGFHEPNVEVLLPISPIVCLHIRPAVERTRRSVRPSVREVNAAQAAFAARFCFSNIESARIDQMAQENFGKAEMGVKGFTVWHRHYETAVYDILMNM